MNRSTQRGLRDLWIPLLVVLAGCAVSGASWWSLVSDRRAQLVAATQESVRESATAVSLRVKSQVAALERLAELRGSYGADLVEEWQASADVLIKAREGLDCIEWVDLDDPAGTLTVGQVRASRLLGLDDETAQAHRDSGPIVLGPETDTNGAPSYRMVLPASSAEGHAGLLVAHVRSSDMLTPLLQARGTDYAVRVEWDGIPIFSRGEPAQPRRQWWRAAQTVTLPHDTHWLVVHLPTAALVELRLTPAPHYLFATGLALSFLLGIVAHQWRLVSRQARFLEAANRALEERGRGLEHLTLELERRVADRTERLEEVVAELEAFNYSVSHDLRSPLGAVLNLAHIVRDDYRDRPLDEEGIALLSRIERAALRATALLEDLLQLSRARRAPLALDTIDMEAMVREVFAQVRAAQEDDDIELVLEPLPPARGDRALLGAVLSNLIANSFKYSRGCDKRRVTVSGRIEGDECIYEVADNGRGFDMRFASKLFGLFERLHTDEKVEGTGVGLALVARILRRHGGRVDAQGEPGVGARFTFALPHHGAEADCEDVEDE